MKFSNVRKTLLINPRFQYRMIGNVLGLCSIIFCLLYAANIFLFYKLTQTGTNIGLPIDHVYFQFVNHERTLMNWVFFGTALLVFLASAIWVMVVSHRIAGPIFRFCKHLEVSAEKKSFDEVKFREDDYFPELADSFNVFTHAHQNKENH